MKSYIASLAHVITHELFIHVELGVLDYFDNNNR